MDTIRMNQKIPFDDDPELFEYLSQFGDRARAYQARKLMLLGLVQLRNLGGPQPEVSIPAATSVTETITPEEENAGGSEDELIASAGVDDLF